MRMDKGEPYAKEIHTIDGYTDRLMDRSENLRSELSEAERNGSDRDIAIAHAQLQMLTVDYLSLVVGILTERN